MKSFESERFEAIIFNQTIQKVRLLERGKELTTKVTKSNKAWRDCSQKLMSLSPIFSMPIFSSTEFSILRILCGSDNVKVTSIKAHPRSLLYVCYSYIATPKATFCQRSLLVPVYLCVKVNAKIVENSCFGPFILQQPYVETYTQLYEYMYICIYIYIYVFIQLCIYCIYVYIIYCMCIYVYVCILYIYYIYIFIYILYIYIYN